ncbi:MAG: recombination protein O N-terminal domain-containing protein [Bacteroidales bacterium]|nr:recombination protein O N-terminal domain-containing protein [Bacteroidales bacterium]
MEKTEAIILNSVKYGDNKLILNAYTRESGRMTLSVAIPKSRNKTSALPYCQPLFQNEIEYSAHGNIRRAARITPAFTYRTIPFDTAKMSVVMFLAEILTKTLTYSEKNEDLYNYLATSLQLLDDQNYKGLNFHIKFLIQLTKYMGFDIRAKHQTMSQYSLIFNQILTSDFVNCEGLQLTGDTRSQILHKTLDYYRLNFETLDNIRSLEVLQKIFH